MHLLVEKPEATFFEASLLPAGEINPPLGYILAMRPQAEPMKWATLLSQDWRSTGKSLRPRAATAVFISG
jgi:hypothetical protein